MGTFFTSSRTFFAHCLSDNLKKKLEEQGRKKIVTRGLGRLNKRKSAIAGALLSEILSVKVKH